MNTRLTARLHQALSRLWRLPAGLAVVLLASCGGGNDATTYRTVALAGELIDYTLDTDNLTYNYTITESQFGLDGTTGSGTLTRNADGSYTPSGAPGSRVVVLPNGLMLGAVRGNFGATDVTTPIIGLTDPAPTSAALAADYNFVQRGCTANVCPVTLGTLRIDAAGTWSACRDANAVAGPCTGTASNGTLEPRGAGMWRMRSSDGTDIGTAIGFNSAGQNVLIVDLKDQRPGGFGVGMLLGGQQVPTSLAATNGDWIAAVTTGQWLDFTANGTDITITNIDGQPMNIGVSFATETPWTGMVTTAWGDVGFIAGAGVYVLKTPAGDVELGVKLH